jgi:hypothetical protein
MACAKRLEAVLEDAPAWLAAQARARIEARSAAFVARRQTLSA